MFRDSSIHLLLTVLFEIRLYGQSESIELLITITRIDSQY